MSKTINVGQPLFNNIEGHPFVLGPQGPYRTKEEAIQALIAFYEGIDEIPNGQECIIAGVKFIWRGNDLYESLAVKTINESQTDLNFYRSPGTYRFNSIRNNNFANLPINNNSSNASITGELVVYSSVEGTTTYRSIIGQVLFLSNAEGHETKIYTRSANKTSKDGGATYEVTWGDWQVCQGMKEVGLVSSYDFFIDNGMYSGIYNNNGIIETFVIITINDYVVKSQFSQPKSISQLKYALNAHTNKSELSIRVGKGEPLTWDDWKSVFDEENITTQITNIQNQLNALTEGTTGNINDIVNKAVNNIVGGAPEAYDTLKEIVDYVNKNKDEVTGQVTDIVTSLNELQNLKIMDLGGNWAPDKVNASIINYVKTNNIKHAIFFKYLDSSQSSVFGVCISRDISRDSNNQEYPSGWIIYLLAKKGIERLPYNSAGVRETWQEYGGILRHQQKDIKNGQLETMSVNGLKSLIVDNLTANESLSSTRKILSILSANQGRILDEKINTKHPILVPGTNIKNINGQSILGEGNIEIKPGITEEEKKVLNDKIDSKAPKVGYAPDLKVNFAKELVGRGEATAEVIGGIRPTGVRSIGDGNATITKIKGESVVWNQGIDGAITFTSMSTQDNITYVSTTTSGSGNLYYALGVAKGSHKYLCTGRIVNSLGTEPRGKIFTYEDGKKIYLAPFDSRNTVSTDDWARIEEPIQFHDLTLMFGTGNEPTTIEEFESRKPLGISNDYNEGEIISYDGDALKSVGFNAFNGTYAKVIGGEVYHATGTTSISFAKELDGAATAISLDSNGKFTPTEDGYVYAEGKDIVIHLTHSYTPEHVDEYEEDVHPLPDVTSILDAEGNQLFPYGLLSAGSVHDEITATKAIKRVGVVDMGTLNWMYRSELSNKPFQTSSLKGLIAGSSQINILCAKYTPAVVSSGGEAKSDKHLYRLFVTDSPNNHILLIKDDAYTDAATFKAAMSGVMLYYELAEPIEVDLPEPLNMTYEAWDFGTEELIAKGATTPLNADIVYQFNAVDRIRENSSAIEDLEGHVEERKDDGIKLLDNGNLELTLKGETREFMPATPSGDPMHWAYVSAGAEYNDTEEDKVKDAPWAALADTDEEKKVTHKAGCWYLNGVGDMTNDDIRYSYINRTLLYDLNRRASFSSDTALRTIYPVYRGSSVSGLGPTKASTLFQCTKLKTCLLSNMQGIRQEHDYSLSLSASYEFYKCTALKAIGQVTPTTTDIYRFAHCTSLRYIWIYALKVSLNLKDSSLISKLSVKYMIENAAPTSAISITLHADAYARLVDDADIVAALEAKNTALGNTGGSVSLVSA